MKNFLVALLVFLVWSVIGLWIYSFGAPSDIAQNEQAPIVSETLNETPKDTPKTTSEVVKDTIATTPDVIEVDTKESESNFSIHSLGNNEILFESQETFAFQKDNNQITIPDELSDVPSLLVDYLQGHPDQELHITSYYSASAQPQTPNIGVQRGSNFKKLLIDEGADKNQITVKSAITTAAFEEDNTINHAMTFAFTLLDKERIANAKSAIPELITFYPKYDFDKVLANNKLADLADEVVAIHEEYPDLMIEVVGHTDHIGASSENYSRGLKSARQIRWYLVTKGGIDRKDIKAISKGETDPILRDGKPASRKENARIEIKFVEKE